MYLFTIIAAVFWAFYEIQIEGKNGWAKELPTWKIKNPFMKMVDWPYVDGYHLWLFILSLFIFHFPYFLSHPLNIFNELTILINYILFVTLEDFFWFVFNPSWGIKKFLTKTIPWQKKKILGFPKNYFVAVLIITILFLIRKHTG